MELILAAIIFSALIYFLSNGFKEILRTIIILIIVMGFLGYGSNIVKLIKCDFKEPYKEEVIRSIGTVVFPMGMIVGYLNIKDGEEVEENQ